MQRKTVLIPLARWVTVALLIGIVLGLAVSQQSARAAPSGQRLRTLAGNFLIGYASANDFASLPDAAMYQETARTEFNILTPENQMKWDTIHPQQNTFNFAPGDQHVQFAMANGMVVHGHNLLWHSQNPNWLNNPSTPWTVSTLTTVLNNHIDTVVGHYRGQVAIWDVVNEAFQDNGQPRQGGESVWFRTFGNTSFIELAFRRARIADPNAVLVYNDFNIEAMNAKSDAVFAMAQDFKARGVPIDGIGFQMHLTSGGIDLISLANNMQRFAGLGLNIYITEMDVRYPTPISQANLTAQATIYQNVLDRCLRQTACKAFQMWGFTDAHSWVPGTFAGQGDALIFDANYNAKPAYFALQSRLVGDAPTPTRTNTPITPTNTPTRTVTPTACPTVTPLPPPQVDPVTSPTSQLSQVITVRASGTVSVRLETGTFTAVSSGGVAQVTVTLNPNTTHHLAVSNRFNEGPPCNRSNTNVGEVTVDRNGNPLIIVQQSSTSTATPTPTPTNTPTPTPTRCPVPTQLPPPQVDPVTSPTSQLSQVITVHASGTVSVRLETGTFTAPTSGGVAQVTVTLNPNTTHHLNVSYSVAGSPPCNITNTGQTTVDRNGNPLTIVHQSSTSVCQVTYTIVNQWNTGFETSLNIKNTGSAAINGWTVGWAFPNGQTITQLWNATWSQTGANVSATNLSWNASIAPNATVNAGFLANWSGTNNKPTAFTLNGASCTVTP